MRFKAILERPGGVFEDIEIAADPGATVGDVAQVILELDPRGDYAGQAGVLRTLEVRATDGSNDVETFDPRDTLDDLRLGSGVVLRVVSEDEVDRPAVARLTVLAGPDRGRTETLYRGTSIVGRGSGADLVLTDPSISKQHARVHATAERVEITDLNSANGILLQDALVPHADLSRGARVTLGETTLEVRMLGASTAPSVRLQEHVHVRSPRVEVRFPGRELESAALPTTDQKQPFPWLVMLLPVVAGGAMFAVTRSPISLIFVAMSPLMMLGTWLTGAATRRRSRREGVARFDEQLDRLTSRLAHEREAERTARHHESPSLVDVATAVMEHSDLLWTRRPEHWSFLYARLGVGAVPARVTVKEPENRDRAIPEYEERFDAAIARHRSIADVPVVEELAAAGALGVAGHRSRTAGYVRGLLAQIAGLHAPADVVITSVVGPAWAAELSDLAWLPHVGAGEALVGAPLGSTPQSCQSLVSRLEELIQQRSGGRERGQSLGALPEDLSALKAGARLGEQGGAPSAYSGPLPAVIVVIADDAPVDTARLIALVERAAGVGVHPIWVAPSPAMLPAACRTLVSLDATGGAEARFVRTGTVVSPLEIETASAEQLRAFAVSLARVSDAGQAGEDSADIPRMAPLVDLVGRDLAADPGAVVDRWLQNGSIPRGGVTPPGYQPKLRALVGQGASGALHIDLRNDGPHALVGGTTGAGKSEFLQSWVLGMAAEYSPERVTFLFVDYKGGSAFADCVELPHCVGLVTDLSPHLVRRALISLRAELHHREELFNRKRAKDILEMEKRGDPDCPPALVIVIDEFAALVSEVPDFVDGVVDVAQRGRSLGIHLIMATQRPAGVIKDNLRANTNLRVALRMADESDSMDVIGSKVAAQLAPEQRGRGAVKSGPGRLTLFQAAYAGGHAFEEQAVEEPTVATLAFGAARPWTRPEQRADAAPVAGTARPTDQQRLVTTMRTAFTGAGLVTPRRPWLDELPVACDLDAWLGGDDARLAFGVIDLPRKQAQEALVFEPEVDQNLAIFGASGSGKTGALRALAVAAGHTERPVHVHVIDAGGTGLAMLEALPHVGSVVSGDDTERVTRLTRMLRSEIEQRNARFGAAGAESLSDYRGATGRIDEPRLLVLVDNFPSLRAEYEGVPGRADAYAALQHAMQEGRAVGVHVAVTADRAASISNSLMATIQKKLVLRLADGDGYGVLGVPRDILTPESPAGRGAIGPLECQIGVPGGVTAVRELKDLLAARASSMPAAHRPAAPPIQALPQDYSRAHLPAQVDQRPVLALSDVALAPHPFTATGAFLVAGGPESGRTSALLSLAQSIARWRDDAVLLHLSARRGELGRWWRWDGSARDADGLAGLDAWVDQAVAGGAPVALVVEAATDFVDTPTDQALQRLLKRARMDELLVIAEVDPIDLSGYSQLKTELKAVRRGMVLRPETADGDAVLKTPFPRVNRSEFTPGRGLWAEAGRVVRIQMPRPLTAAEEGALLAPRPERTAPVATPDLASPSTPAAGSAPSEPAAAAAIPSWAMAPGRD